MKIRGNLINDQAREATKEELKAQKHRCWSPDCKNYAWLEDPMGWHWCLKHWWRNYRWGGGEVSIRSLIYRLIHTTLK